MMLSVSVHQILIMELCVGSHGAYNVYAFVSSLCTMYDGHRFADYPVALNLVPGYSAALYPFVGGEGYEFN